jgi:signal recognition particle receptor subunit beta
VAAKFKVADVPVHLDNKPKTQGFVDLITKVEVDSAKQKTFILKKEHIVEYGKSTSADTVVAINFNTMASDYSPFDFAKFVNLNEDISVIDVETGKYVQNTVFGTGDTISRPKAIDRLLEKLTAEFMLKPQKQQ